MKSYLRFLIRGNAELRQSYSPEQRDALAVHIRQQLTTGNRTDNHITNRQRLIAERITAIFHSMAVADQQKNQSYLLRAA